MELEFSVHARQPQMGDTLVFTGDGWEPQAPYARPQRETYVRTNTVPQINNGLVRSPNFVSGSAGWQIEADGSAEFNDVVVRGTIYASAGEIAGWTIASGHLYAGTGVGRVGLRPADYPFYAGAENPAAAPFRVTAAGALVATSATITGSITATSGTIGGWDITATQIQATDDVILLDSAGIITVGGAGYLTSDPFTSGTEGWRITPTEAEFGNITARGEIRTAVFKYNEVHAQAGQLLVTPNAAKLDADLTIAASGSFNVGEAGRFAASDIVRLKDGTGDVWLSVVADVGDGTYTYTRSSGSAVGTVFRCGTAVVGYGASGEGGIVLDAVTANGPFMDIFTHAGSPWSALTTKVRVGNLAGITDVELNPTGYGFYSDNAYLRGDLLAGGGKVLIDSLGMHVDIEGATPSSGVIKFEDFDATYDFWALMWTYTSGSAHKFHLRNRAATGTYTTAVTNLTAEGASATSETTSEVYLSAPTGWSGLRAAAGTYAVVGVWDGAATVVRPKTTWNSGGDIVHKLFESAGVNKVSIQDGAEVEVAYVNSDGKVLCVSDVHPDSDGRGMFARVLNRLGISTYTDHFRSGNIPTGYSWQGAPFGGTAPTLSYNQSNDYLRCVPAASTRYFLSKAVTNSAASWQNKSLYGRFNGRLNGRFGLRFDDGTDNNYAQIYGTGEANNGTMSVSFQYRAGGGAVTTVTSAITMPGTEFICLKLLMAYSAPNYTAYGYLVCEDGSTNYVTGFTVAVAWAPAAGRAGLFVENPSISAATWQEADWFYNEFT